ncbi:hypothetical protein QO010_000017 [Caulobacter ginsengisoli]|uniref:Uncharacterized protein n=1 Tax=Caulobacter ginsengisoli TaxID=400775 RepID=A0ABU0IMP7_9CAUL|nr:hypothetical protein [Caulobacter ginsengisoli]MDQ0462269.1 hypothetical protein [Caulobacter ginsengisoli]
MNDAVIKEIRRADGKRRVSILRRHGLYTFVEDADGDTFTYEAWPALAEGGLYDSPGAAEREARARIAWLAQQESGEGPPC